jgi:hypothetical protein
MVEGIVGQRAFGAKMTIAERTERFGMGLVEHGLEQLGYATQELGPSKVIRPTLDAGSSGTDQHARLRGPERHPV